MVQRKRKVGLSIEKMVKKKENSGEKGVKVKKRKKAVV